MNMMSPSPARREQQHHGVAITVKTIDEYLQNAYDMAMAANAPGDAVTATLALAQLHGLIPPMKRMVDAIQICERCNRPQRSSAEIEGELRRLIEGAGHTGLAD